MKRLLIAAIVLSVLFGVVSASPYIPPLTGYGNVTTYYYNITAGAGAQGDYQVKFILSNSSGISGYYSGENIIYTNGTTRPDWYDVNATDDASAPLKFWIENNTQTAKNATAWVKVPTISTANSSSGKWYYGNASQNGSTMDGLNTFVAFEDFNGATINSSQWYFTSGLAPSGGTLTLTSAGAIKNISSATQYSGNYTMKSRLQSAHVGSTGSYQESMGFGIGSAGAIFANAATASPYYGTYNGSWRFTNAISGWSASTYHTIKLDLTSTQSFNGSVDEAVPTVVNSPYYGGVLSLGGVYVGTVSGSQEIVDWIFISKSVYPGPTTSAYVTSPTTSGGSLVASFTQSPNPSSAGQSVTFTDTSTGSPTTWNWTFGDVGGSNTSTSQNPTHTYSTAGNYTVLLNVSNSTGSFSTASAWHNVTNASAFYPQDVWMEGQYNRTFHITSASDGTPLAATYITSDGQSGTASTLGYAFVTEGFGIYTITVSMEGYSTKTVSFIVDEDGTTEIQLTPTESTGSSKLNVLYPHEVRITCVDEKGVRLQGVLVAGIMVNSTVDNTNWFSTLFSISETATPINGTEIGGITDTGGAVVMPMIGSGYYRLIFNSTTYGINQKEYFLQPQYNDYVYQFETLTDVSAANPDDYINITLGATDSGAATIYLNASYNDSSSTTSNVTFFVNYPNRTLLYSKSYPSVSGSNQSVVVSYAVTNTAGASYVYGMSGNSTLFGVRNESQGISLKGTTGIMYNPFVYKGSW